MPQSNISFHGDSAEILDEVTNLFAREVVARVSTDVLEAEFRMRMREQGKYVLTGYPDDLDQQSVDCQQLKQSLEASEVVPTTTEQSEPTAPATEPSVQNSSLSEKIFTQADVMTALNVYGISHGRPATVQLLVDVTGCTRLKDVAPEHYWKIIASVNAVH